MHRKLTILSVPTVFKFKFVRCTSSLGGWLKNFHFQGGRGLGTYSYAKGRGVFDTFHLIGSRGKQALRLKLKFDKNANIRKVAEAKLTKVFPSWPLVLSGAKAPQYSTNSHTIYIINILDVFVNKFILAVKTRNKHICSLNLSLTKKILRTRLVRNHKVIIFILEMHFTWLYFANVSK